MTVTASNPNGVYYLGGERYVKKVASPASTAINPGDALWLNTATAAIASAKSWNSSLGQTQIDFRAKFLGIAIDQKSALDPGTQDISYDTVGEFYVPCAALSGAHHIGEFVAPDKDTGNNLLDQQWAIVADAAHGCGVLVEEAANGQTFMKIRIQSFLVFGGYAS